MPRSNFFDRNKFEQPHKSYSLEKNGFFVFPAFPFLVVIMIYHLQAALRSINGRGRGTFLISAYFGISSGLISAILFVRCAWESVGGSTTTGSIGNLAFRPPAKNTIVIHVNHLLKYIMVSCPLIEVPPLSFTRHTHNQELRGRRNLPLPQIYRPMQHPRFLAGVSSLFNSICRYRSSELANSFRFNWKLPNPVTTTSSDAVARIPSKANNSKWLALSWPNLSFGAYPQ